MCGTVLAPGLASADSEGADTFASRHARHSGLVGVGLTSDQRLVGFDTADPTDTWSFGRIKGLTGDSKLVGIDFRVQNGKLYGVGDRGGVSTVDSDAKAVKVSQLTVGLQGRHFGVDFNPPPTVCASSPTQARTCATTSTTRPHRGPPPRTGS